MPEGRLRCGVVGAGAMGGNHLRILGSLEDVELIGVFDRDAEVGEAAAARYGISCWRDLEAAAAGIDAAVVAVPTESHVDAGVRLLEAGVHVLIEKPIAASLDEADRLVAAAENNDRVLAVGHVEFHNPAVRRLVDEGVEPLYLEIHRMGGFSPRSLDIDVVLDLMIHDLQIVHALDGSATREVRATGVSVLSDRVDLASARVECESGCVANITASRVSLEKVRKLRIFTREHYYSLDYAEQAIRRVGLETGEGGPKIVEEDLSVTREEPLRLELIDFAAACRGLGARVVGGAEARRALASALRVIEAMAA